MTDSSFPLCREIENFHEIEKFHKIENYVKGRCCAQSCFPKGLPAFFIIIILFFKEYFTFSATNWETDDSRKLKTYKAEIFSI